MVRDVVPAEESRKRRSRSPQLLHIEAVSDSFPQSLCHRCVHLRLVQTDRSTFLLCKHPALPKYPPQPVHACPGFVAR